MSADIQIRIEKVSSRVYEEWYAREAVYAEMYIDNVQDPSYVAGRVLAETVWRLKEYAKEMYERLRGKAIIISFHDDVNMHNFWLEWKTDGIVYGKVLGNKKRYQLRLPLPPMVICDYEKCIMLGSESDLPSFEVTMDFVSIYVMKDKKKIRRFWEREGKIEIYLAMEKLKTYPPEIQKIKIGEIKVVWMGHREVDRLAGLRVRRLRKLIEELRQKKEAAFNVMEKVSIANMIRKLEEKLQRELLKTQKQWIAGLKIEGKIGEIPIRKIVAFAKKPEVKAPVSPRTKEIESDRWGVKVVDGEELKRLLEGKKFVTSFVLRDGETKLRGLHGWMNHVIRILGIPKRKIEVEVLVQARESAWRKLIKVNKHPIKISEYIDEDRMVKYWIIEPIDNVARFSIINKDHRSEGLDRILVHVKKGRYVVFYHEL